MICSDPGDRSSRSAIAGGQDRLAVVRAATVLVILRNGYRAAA